MRFRVALLVAILLPASIAGLADATQQKKDLAAALRELGPVIDPKSEEGKLLPQMLAKDLKARRDAVNKEDSAHWHALKTREEWEKFKRPRIEALKRSLGQWPQPPKDLKVRVTKTLDGEGFFIDNLVFESRPSLLVTANLYRPAQPSEKMPGILLCHSHHNPKTEGELQDMGMTWARQGCYVLVMDQLGHGERRQHPFSDAKKFPEAFKVGRQDYYFRYNVAAQLHLVGESLMGWMVWDMMRGVDLLYQQRGIDKERIMLLGSVAGGGDPAAVTAALDERIMVAVPFNFGGPQPETVYPLPDDAETSFNYLGGGSWESTRNLRLSGREGFAPWVIVASIAPRRLIYAHEFSWDRERDPVWKRLQKVYDWYGVPDNLSFTTGKGKLVGDPDATHCNNIGAFHRKGIHAALKKWFATPIPEEYRKRRPPEDLQCLTPEIAKEMKPVHQLAAELAKERLYVSRAKWASVEPAKRKAQARVEFAMLLGNVDPPTKPDVHLFGGPAIDNSAGFHDLVVIMPGATNKEAMQVPARIILPRGPGKRLGCIVAVAQEGIAGFLKRRSETIAALVQQRFAVCLVEVRGSGSTDPSASNRGRQSTATSLSASEQMLGQTMLGARVRDLRAALIQLRKHYGDENSNLGPFFLWGDSFAPVNAADARVEVPHEVKQPPHAEPMGGLVVLLTALLEDDIKGVYVRGGLASYQSLLASPFLHVPHDAILPGVLTVGDLPDLVTLLAPRPVRLDGLVDGLNRRVDKTEPLNDQQLVQWFATAAK